MNKNYMLPAIFFMVMVFVTTAALAAKDSVKGTNTVITVELNKGKIITLDKAASSVLLANPDIADVDTRSPHEIFLFGKALGETTVYAYDGDNKQILSAIIKVTHNISAMNDVISQIAPDSHVKVTSTDRGMIITGDVSSPKDADNVMRLAGNYIPEGGQVMNMMDVKGSTQVALRVRVAEVSKTNLKNFGINLQNLLTRGTFALGFGVGRDFIDAAGNIVLPPNSDSIVFRDGTTDLNGMLEALETEGYAKILAEPNLTTTSGRNATFLAGGEIPIPVPGDNGTIGIEYRQFGVSLSFTPTVINKNKIVLDVRPEVSSLSQNGALSIQGFSIPSFTVKRASTNVELGSGQSIAIAGLLQNDVSHQITKFPWLGDVPILGTLFRSNNFQNNETELVILVTPYIVKAVDDVATLSLPGQNDIMPGDFERIFLGKLVDYRTGGTPATPSTISLLDSSKHHGKIGYILE